MVFALGVLLGLCIATAFFAALLWAVAHPGCTTGESREDTKPPRQYDNATIEYDRRTEEACLAAYDGGERTTLQQAINELQGRI